MPPVVGEKYNDGIVGKFESVQGCEHRPDAVVRTLDHGGIGGVLVSFGRFFGLVLLLEFGLGLNRGMYRIMSQIEEEGLVLVGFDELACLDTQPVGQVFALFLVFQIRILVRTMVTASAGTAPRLARDVYVETLRGWIISQVPFTHGGGDVPGRLEGFGHSHELVGKFGHVLDGNQLAVLGRAAIRIPHRVYTVPRRILAGHQAGSTWSAVRGVGIGVHKNHAVFGQLVDVRTLVIFRPHVPKVGPTEIVDEKEHDVWLGLTIRPEKRSGVQDGEGDENRPMKNHLARMNPKSRPRQVGRDPLTSLMLRGAGFVFFVVTADRATLAKAEIQEMSGSKRDACAGGKKIVS